MKKAMKRTLAMVIAVLLTIPTFSLAEETDVIIYEDIQPTVVEMEDFDLQVWTEADGADAAFGDDVYYAEGLTYTYDDVPEAEDFDALDDEADSAADADAPGVGSGDAAADAAAGEQPADFADEPEGADAVEEEAPEETFSEAPALSADVEYFDSWADLQDAILDAGDGDVFALDGEPVIRVKGGELTLTDTVGGGAVTGGKRLTLDLNGCTLDGAGIDGEPVIRVKGGELTLTDTVGGGAVTGGGLGGVAVDSGKFTLESGAIRGNNGGGVAVTGGTFAMTGGGVSDNSAPAGGGGVAVKGGKFTLSNGSVTANSASVSGGGVAVTGGTFAMTGGGVSDNSAPAGGGVAVHRGGTFNLSGGAVSGNTASGNGGGVLLEKGGAFVFSGGSVEANHADGIGGGAFAEDTSLEIAGGSLSRNRAAQGGGAGMTGAGTLTVSSGAVSYNTAGEEGGGLYVADGALNLKGGSVANNSAKKGGGAFIARGRFDMPQNILDANTATVGGAGIALSDMTVSLPGPDCVLGNYAGGAESDYWLQGGAKFNVTDALPDDYRVYVAADTSAGAGMTVVAAGSLKALSTKNFISAAAGSAIGQSVDGSIVLGAPVTVRFSAGEGSGAMADATAIRGGVFTLPQARFTAPSGLYLLGWQLANGEDRTIKAAGHDLPVTDDVLGADGALELVAQWGQGTQYVDENGISRTAGDVTPLSGIEDAVDVTLETGWYLADGATFKNRVAISGDVNIIIDNVHTTAMERGIQLPAGSKLTVWGQGGWERSSGRLAATGVLNGYAGIGGMVQSLPGAFVLRSGEVEATGGINAAGVGGGDGVCGGSVTIHGGKLTARGGDNGAGIGGGLSANQGGAVSIYGGTVTAIGGTNAAGIGGGKYNYTELSEELGGDGALVVIMGASVVARGGDNAAGIGGGYGGSGGSVTISRGAVVEAHAGGDIYSGAEEGYEPQGIGRGSYVNKEGIGEGTLSLSDKCVVMARETSGPRDTAVTYGGNARVGACRLPFVWITGEAAATTFSAVPGSIDTALVGVSIYKEGAAASGEGSVTDAAAGDRIVVKVAPRNARVHYDGVTLAYTYHGEDFTVEDYAIRMDGETAFITFEMPRANVVVTPKIRQDQFKITFKAIDGNGTAVAKVGNVAVTEAPEGATVSIFTTPGTRDWFVESATIVNVQASGNPEVPWILGSNANIRNFTMPAANVEISLQFLEGKWHIENGREVFQQYHHSISEDDSVLAGSGKADGWYYLDHSITLKNRVNLTCEVHLVLGKGVKLNCPKGLRVAEDQGGKLYLYEEALNSGCELYCDASDEDDCAGIGGNDKEKGGEVHIYGGKVTAKGGDSGAGIGGGNEGKSGAYTQHGGTVYAYGGEYAAGVGGGEKGDSADVLLYGGTLTAKGGKHGAGVGGGESGSQTGEVHVYNSATLNATGGYKAAGIGGGREYNSNIFAGKRLGGDGGNVYIYIGSSVTARGGEYGAGIGGGIDGYGGNVHVIGGYVNAYGGKYGAGIGGGRGKDNLLFSCTGVVYAEGGYGGAGIGSGEYGNAKSITIRNDGYRLPQVHATGYGGGAGIGGGRGKDNLLFSCTGGVVYAEGGYGGAGIGGGKRNGGGTVNISVGNVYAMGYQAIGSGDGGSKNNSLTISGNPSVAAGSAWKKGTLVSGDKVSACQSNSYAEVVNCTHDDWHYQVHDKATQIDATYHLAGVECRKCGSTFYTQEEHEYLDRQNFCFQCGYVHPDVTLRFDPGVNPLGDVVEVAVPYNSEYELPYPGVNVPKGYEYAVGWPGHALWDVPEGFTFTTPNTNCPTPA